MMKILCIRCGEEILIEMLACPACNFVGPGATVPTLSAFDAAKMADGLPAPGWDANGSPVEG